MGVGDSHDQRLQQLPLLNAVSQLLYPCGVDGAHGVPRGRRSCGLRCRRCSSWTQPSTCLPFTDSCGRYSTHLSLHSGVNTRQPKAFRPRVAGAENCEWTALGIAVAGLPPSMNRGKRKPASMRLHGRVTAIREFSGSDAFAADHFCLSTGFLHVEKKMRGILAHMPCRDGDLASLDVEGGPR